MLDMKTLQSQLYSSVLSDTLDSFGRMGQAMRPFVRPLDDRTVICGRLTQVGHESRTLPQISSRTNGLA